PPVTPHGQLLLRYDINKFILCSQEGNRICFFVGIIGSYVCILILDYTLFPQAIKGRLLYRALYVFAKFINS
ncbi:hypothetical protein, partial [Pseudoalteromonas ruthenica]|uniref:hypothetical protein n=1 Tax=Pseudoalteromonas ruthenica TaxID=151081 RepID=UPI001BB1E0D6